MPIDRILLALRVRSTLVIAVFAVTTAAALVGSLVLPRQYRSTAQILIDVDAPDTISGAPTPIYPQQTQEFMATLTDVIVSDRVVDKVIEDLKLTESKDAMALWRKDTDGKLTAKEYFAEALRKHLEIKPTRESSVVALSYTHRSPQVAAQAANSFVQAVIATQVELRAENAKSNVVFFDARTGKLRQNLEEAEARLSRFQQEKGIVGSDERVDSELIRLNELTTQLTLAQAQRLDSTARAQQDPNLKGAAPDVVQSPVVQGLRAELARAEANLRELSSRVGVNHPQYIRAAAAVQSLKNQIASEIEQVGSNVRAVNQVNVSRESELRAEVDGQKAKVLAMGARREQANMLQKDVDSAQHAYDLAKLRLSQSSMASQIDHTNITLLSEARPPSVHFKPKIKLNMLIGAVLGLLLGMTSAIAWEHFERRLRTPQDAAQVLGVPLLGSMPGSMPPRADPPRLLQWS